MQSPDERMRKEPTGQYHPAPPANQSQTGGRRKAGVRVFGRRIPLPRRRPFRIGLGVALLAGGVVGFLPVVGFWMIPAGIAVLAVDLPVARRLERRVFAFARRAWRQVFGKEPVRKGEAPPRPPCHEPPSG